MHDPSRASRRWITASILRRWKGSRQVARSAVVVVDDEAPIVEVVREALGDEGLRTLACAHGAEAHACIRQERPYLVILDLQMPMVDGVEVFQQMRADPATAATPVIFLTANAHILEQRLPNYQELGAQLLRKPFNIDDLIEAISRVLQ